jgi:hypothetical protein
MSAIEDLTALLDELADNIRVYWRDDGSSVVESQFPGPETITVGKFQQLQELVQLAGVRLEDALRAGLAAAQAADLPLQVTGYQGLLQYYRFDPVSFT